MLLPSTFTEDAVLLHDEHGRSIRKTSEKRSRIFTPLIFLATMFRLIGTDSKDGVQILLDGLFGLSPQKKCPSDSAFCQFRKTISWTFLAKLFSSLRDFASENGLIPTWNGRRWFAIDGDVYSMKRTSELIREGFRGQQCTDDRETYLLKAYLTLQTCMITGATLGFTLESKSDEIGGACELLKQARPSDVFVVDRLYFSLRFVTAVAEAKAGFVCRLRARAMNEITAFVESGKASIVTVIYGVKVRLVRVERKNNEAEPVVLATNLPVDEISDEQLGEIYSRRWTAETANRDMTVNHLVDHFHAHSKNGILQEIYAACILRLLRALLVCADTRPQDDFLKATYKRPNMKQISRAIFANLFSLLFGSANLVLEKIGDIVRSSMEVRTHNRRLYQRMTSGPRKKEFRSRTVPCVKEKEVAS